MLRCPLQELRCAKPFPTRANALFTVPPINYGAPYLHLIYSVTVGVFLYLRFALAVLGLLKDYGGAQFGGAQLQTQKPIYPITSQSKIKKSASVHRLLGRKNAQNPCPFTIFFAFSCLRSWVSFCILDKTVYSLDGRV